MKAGREIIVHPLEKTVHRVKAIIINESAITWKTRSMNQDTKSTIADKDYKRKFSTQSFTRMDSTP